MLSFSTNIISKHKKLVVLYFTTIPRYSSPKGKVILILDINAIFVSAGTVTTDNNSKTVVMVNGISHLRACVVEW